MSLKRNSVRTTCRSQGPMWPIFTGNRHSALYLHKVSVQIMKFNGNAAHFERERCGVPVCQAERKPTYCILASRRDKDSYTNATEQYLQHVFSKDNALCQCTDAKGNSLFLLTALSIKTDKSKPLKHAVASRCKNKTATQSQRNLENLRN